MEKVEKETHNNWDMIDQITKQVEEKKTGVLQEKKEIPYIGEAIGIKFSIEHDKNLFEKILKKD